MVEYLVNKKTNQLFRRINCPGKFKCPYAFQYKVIYDYEDCMHTFLDWPKNNKPICFCGIDCFENGRWYKVRLCEKYDFKSTLDSWGILNYKKLTKEEASLYLITK